MTIATIFIDENFDIMKKILKNIKVNNNLAIVFSLGNYELNGLPFKTSKVNKTEKLLKLGFDLVIEIPSIFCLSNVDNLCTYLIKIFNVFDVRKVYLPSEFGSIKSFKAFHSKFNFYYPSYDKIFNFYLANNSFYEARNISKKYINDFYKNKIYDNFNLNLINYLRKNSIKFKLIKSSFLINIDNEIYNNYFSYFKLDYTFSSVESLLERKTFDINTINMIKNKIYKLESIEDLFQLSAPKNFQFSPFFRSLLSSIIHFDYSNEILDYSIIKCLGFNKNGSIFLKNNKKKIAEENIKFITSIKPSNSLFETYQYKLEVFYSYLLDNKYNSNNDLFIFPVKFDEK